MKTKYLRVLLLGLLVCVFVLSACTNRQGTAQKEWIDPLTETAEQRDARMEWWREARFGLFIHWGVYSVPAGTYAGERIGGIGEWILLKAKIPIAEYKSYAQDFNPVHYDPKAWVKMAKDAGMKYIVITSKHHDGFALFDSKVTDWDIADASPYGKDLLKPLVEEAKKEGIKIGFYYSQAQDWTHPGGAKSGYKEGEYWDESHAGSFDDYLKEIAYPQAKEILTNYDIDILWWDTPRWMNKERAELLRPLIALRPGLITNNRLGGGYKGDSDTPEQHVPATGIEGRDWEVCMTMNHTWGYKSYDDDWKSTEDLLHKLIDIASKGGNFLLNVGPKPDGTIPQASIDRLAEIGGWMDVNSESIYGTAASPFRRPWWGRCTRKELENGDTRLYLQVFDWPEDNLLVVPVNNEAVQCYSLYGNKETFEVEKAEEGLVVRLTGEAADEISSVVVLDIKGSPDVPNQNITQNETGVLLLSPEKGDLENRGYVSSNHARLIRDTEFSYITWKEIRTWMEWPIEIGADTVFDVYVKIATTSADNKITIEVGEEKKEFQLPDTNGLDSFQEVRIGTINIPGGTSTLTVKGESDKWQECYMSDIELRPAK
ncbi:alpha-L-fucosidase [Acidobacteriota bacterium]